MKKAVPAWLGVVVFLVLFLGCGGGGCGGAPASPVAQTSENFSSEMNGNHTSAGDSQASAAVIATKVYQSLDFTNTMPVDDENGISYVKSLLQIYTSDPNAVAALTSQYDATLVNSRESTGMYTLQLNGERSVAELKQTIAQIADDSRVFAASPKLVPSPMLTEPDDPWNDDAIDWDEEYQDGYNWGVKAIKMPSAWDYNKFLSSVAIGVVDAGFVEHEDLKYAAPVEVIPFNTAWDAGNQMQYENNRNHGTHIAGCMAALWNSVGITGIVKNADLYTATFSYSFDSDPLERLMAYSPVAVNLAMGHKAKPSTADAFETRLKADRFFSMKFLRDDLGLTERQTIVVVPAGNGNVNTLASSHLAHVNHIQRDHNESVKELIGELRPHIVIVGSSDENNDHADGSNYGDAIDIYAPGVQILSAVQNGYALRSGTSAAAAYVTGVLGMIYGANPQLDAKEAKEILLKGARLGGVEIDTKEGVSRKYLANAKKSVELALYGQTFVGTFENDTDDKISDIVMTFDPISMTLSGTLVFGDLLYKFKGEFALSNEGFEDHGEIVGHAFEIQLPTDPIYYQSEELIVENAYFDLSGDTLKLIGSGAFLGMDEEGEQVSVYIEFSLQPGESRTYEAPAKPTIDVNEANGEITMTSIDGGTIYYTIENADEDTLSVPVNGRYIEPFRLSNGAKVKSIANKNGVASDVQSVVVGSPDASSESSSETFESSEASSSEASSMHSERVSSERPVVSSSSHSIGSARPVASSSASSECFEFFPDFCKEPTVNTGWSSSRYYCKDYDGDYICYDQDNCPNTYNPDQTDKNGNRIGDECEAFASVRPLPSSAASSAAPERPHPSDIRPNQAKSSAKSSSSSLQAIISSSLSSTAVSSMRSSVISSQQSSKQTSSAVSVIVSSSAFSSVSSAASSTQKSSLPKVVSSSSRSSQKSSESSMAVIVSSVSSISSSAASSLTISSAISSVYSSTSSASSVISSIVSSFDSSESSSSSTESSASLISSSSSSAYPIRPTR